MKLITCRCLPLLFIFLFYFQLNAANRYWVASSASNWSSSTNWSTFSGGPAGASVPSNSDEVFFDGNSPFNCIVSHVASINYSKVNILVYPNPATDYLFIKGMEPTDEAILLDKFGTVLHKGNQNKINIQHFTEGSYYLKIVDLSGNTKLVKKIIKLR